MSPEDGHLVYCPMNQYDAHHEISPLLPALLSPLIIYNGERLQNVSPELRYLTKKVFKKEALDLT